VLAFAALAVLLPLLAVYAFWRGWRTLHCLRAVVDHPSSRVRSAPQGYVELRGRAVLLPGVPNIAPLSGLPCCWYRYRVEQRDEEQRWVTIDRGECDGLFGLDDGDARCVIDPEQAQIIKVRTERWHAAGTDGTLRYSEQRIIPGEALHVLGWLRTEGGAGAATDIVLETRLQLEDWKRDPQRMSLFDRNGDGQLDATEWEAVRRAARRQVEREARLRALEPGLSLLSNPQDRRLPFLISTLPERSLCRWLRWQIAAWWAGAALAAWGAQRLLVV